MPSYRQQTSKMTKQFGLPAEVQYSKVTNGEPKKGVAANTKPRFIIGDEDNDDEETVPKKKKPTDPELEAATVAAATNRLAPPPSADEPIVPHKLA